MFRLVLTITLVFQGSFGLLGGGGVLGGWSDVRDTQSPRVKQALAAAAKNVEANDENLVLKYESLVSAKQQVVNGINYKLVIQFSVLASKKGLLGIPRSVVYEVVVNQPPSENSVPVVLSSNLVSMVARGSPIAVAPDSGCIPGAPCEAQVTPDVEQAAQAVVSTMQSSNSNTVTNMKIVSVRKQVVAGMNYFLSLRMIVNGQASSVKATVFRGVDGKFTVVEMSMLIAPVTAPPRSESNVVGEGEHDKMSGGLEIGLIVGVTVVGVVLAVLCLAWTRIMWMRKGFDAIGGDQREEVRSQV